MGGLIGTHPNGRLKFPGTSETALIVERVAVRGGVARSVWVEADSAGVALKRQDLHQSGTGSWWRGEGGGRLPLEFSILSALSSTSVSVSLPFLWPCPQGHVKVRQV